MKSEHYCKECRYWYGAEDDEYGPCQLKQARGERRFVTFGGHFCDEPQALAEYGVVAGPLVVRQARAEELRLAAPLLTAEGWSLAPAELARLFALGGAIGAFEGERLVGFLTFIDTPPYRWVGNVAVDTRLRGRGIGARMVAQALVGAERAALYSVEKAAPLYARAGLVAAGEVLAMRGEDARPLEAGRTRALTPDDIPAVLALDRAATGMDRSGLLRALVGAYPARVLDRDAKLVGFGIAKVYPDVTEIGPLVAEDAADARAILDDILSTTLAPHDIAVHGSNTAMIAAAKERGFSTNFRAIPMFRGGEPAWDLARYHAAAGLEKG